MSEHESIEEPATESVSTSEHPPSSQLMKSAEVDYRDFDIGITVDVEDSRGRTYRWVHCFATHTEESVRLGCLDEEILEWSGLTRLTNSRPTSISVDDQVTRAVQQIKQSIDWWHDGTTDDRDVERAARAGLTDAHSATDTDTSRPEELNESGEMTDSEPPSST